MEMTYGKLWEASPIYVCHTSDFSESDTIGQKKNLSYYAARFFVWKLQVSLMGIRPGIVFLVSWTFAGGSA